MSSCGEGSPSGSEPFKKGGHTPNHHRLHSVLTTDFTVCMYETKTLRSILNRSQSRFLTKPTDKNRSPSGHGASSVGDALQLSLPTFFSSRRDEPRTRNCDVSGQNGWRDFLRANTYAINSQVGLRRSASRYCRLLVVRARVYLASSKLCSSPDFVHPLFHCKCIAGKRRTTTTTPLCRLVCLF